MTPTPTNPPLVAQAIPPASAVPAPVPVPTDSDWRLFSQIKAIIQSASPVASFREDCCKLIAAHVAAVCQAEVDEALKGAVICNEINCPERAQLQADRDKLAGELAQATKERGEYRQLWLDADESIRGQGIELARVREENEALRAADRNHLAATNGMRIRLTEELTAERAAHELTKKQADEYGNEMLVAQNLLYKERDAHATTRRVLDEAGIKLGALERVNAEWNQANAALQAQLDQARAEAERRTEQDQLALDCLGGLAKLVTNDDGIDPEAFHIELTREDANLIKMVAEQCGQLRPVVTEDPNHSGYAKPLTRDDYFRLYVLKKKEADKALATATRHADLAKEMAGLLEDYERELECCADPNFTHSRLEIERCEKEWAKVSAVLARYNEAIKEGKS